MIFLAWVVIIISSLILGALCIDSRMTIGSSIVACGIFIPSIVLGILTVIGR